MLVGSWLSNARRKIFLEHSKFPSPSPLTTELQWDANAALTEGETVLTESGQKFTGDMVNGLKHEKPVVQSKAPELIFTFLCSKKHPIAYISVAESKWHWKKNSFPLLCCDVH